MKKITFPLISIIIMVLTGAGVLFAGERAEFINLGFTREADAFLYGQYGIDVDGTFMYAEVDYHNLEENRGVDSLSYAKRFPLDFLNGQDGLSALLAGLQEYLTVSPVDADFTSSGQILYRRLPGELPQNQVSFTDLQDDTRYTVSINKLPRVPTPDRDVRMTVTVYAADTAGSRRRYDFGSLTEPLEKTYEAELMQVLTDAERNWLVCIFQTRETGETREDVYIRYTVRSISLS